MFAVACGCVAPGIEAADLPAFVTRGDHDPVTVGVDVAVVPLRAGGAIVLLDMEGIDNFDHPTLTILLGFLTQITGRLVFATREYSGALFTQLTRTAAAVNILDAAPGQISRRAPLHILYNPRDPGAAPVGIARLLMDPRWEVSYLPFHRGIPRAQEHGTSQSLLLRCLAGIDPRCFC